MAETGATGGLSALTLGGIATTVVVIGGAVAVWLGVFDDKGDGSGGTGTDQGGNSIAISPSANPPVIIEGVTQQSDPVATEEGADTPVQDSADAPAEAETPPAPETAQATESTEAAETAQATEASEPKAEPEVAAATDAQTEASPGQTAEPAADVGQPEVAEPASEGAVDPAASGAVETAEAAAEEAPLFESPQLDLVRVDPSGQTVIAGRATAGVSLQVLLDGVVLEQVEVQPGGEFVAFASIPPSAQARVISLRAEAEGQMRLSDSSFILAPASQIPASSAPVVASNATDDTAAEAAEEARQLAEAATTEAPETQEGDIAQNETAQNETVQNSSTAATDAPADISAVETETQVAKTEAPSSATAPATGPAKAPGGVVVAEAPASVQPSAEGEAPAATVTADAETTVSEPEATSPGAAEVRTEVATETAPQPAPAQVAVLRADAEGVTLVQPAAPKPQDKVVLDTISYSDLGEVQLAGRAGPDAEVRVYLDNAAAGQFRATQTGNWGGNLQAVDPGVYTLRLDEVNAEGKVLSRLETPFKREAPEVLQLPAADGQADAEAPLVRAVTVQEGDTLWAISQKRYGSGFLYVRVFEANHEAIRNPDLIYPGQVFTIPE